MKHAGFLGGHCARLRDREPRRARRRPKGTSSRAISSSRVERHLRSCVSTTPRSARPRRDAEGVVRNAVLMLHGTTGSGTGLVRPMSPLFAPGELLDTATYYIVFPDGIGHGRSSKPSDGARMRFPKYTYDDMVDAQHRLLTEGLGVRHLRLVMGTSMGCMHAWVWGERYVGFADALVPLACAPTRDRRPQPHDPQADHRRYHERSRVEERRVRAAAIARHAGGDGESVHYDVGAAGAASSGTDAGAGRLCHPRVHRASSQGARCQRRDLRIRGIARLRSGPALSSRSPCRCSLSTRQTIS